MGPIFRESRVNLTPILESAEEEVKEAKLVNTPESDFTEELKGVGGQVAELEAEAGAATEREQGGGGVKELNNQLRGIQSLINNMEKTLKL